MSAQLAFFCPLLRERPPAGSADPIDISRAVAVRLGGELGLDIHVVNPPAGLLYLLHGDTLLVRPGMPVSCAIGRLRGVPRWMRCERVAHLGCELGNIPLDWWLSQKTRKCWESSGVFAKVG